MGRTSVEWTPWTRSIARSELTARYYAVHIYNNNTALILLYRTSLCIYMCMCMCDGVATGDRIKGRRGHWGAPVLRARAECRH